MGKKCPFCNQIITEEEQHSSFGDSAPCGACQIERPASEQQVGKEESGSRQKPNLTEKG